MANIRNAKPLLDPSAFPVAVIGAVIVVAVVFVLFTVSSSEIAFRTAPTRGADRLALAQTSTTAAAPADFDHDGTPDAKDADRDNDGWLNIDDPKPDSGVYVAGKWYPNGDNDAVADFRQDSDEDNDGVLDAPVGKTGGDKYPNDINNNGVPDPKERREKGERYDGDGDGKPDLAEFRKVALAQADKLGIRISHTVRHLADIPPGVFRELPEGWVGICQDRDNDGLPDAIDKFDRSFGGSYGNYVSDGKWEKSWESHADDWKKHGFVSTGIAGILGEPPRFEVPKEWAAGYVPGAGFTTGGPDPSASFYGHIPTSEQHLYQPPPEGFAPPAQYPAGSTEAPPPSYEAPHVESSMPPPTSYTEPAPAPAPAPPPEYHYHYP